MSLLDAPVVAKVFRNGFLEAVHHGVVVATDAHGDVLWSAGDPRTPILPRSTAKPLQAVASLRAGCPAHDELLALVCSSHSAEKFHRDGIRRLLALKGLDESALRNTPAMPINEDERNRWIAAGRGPEPIAQDCSGKHSGFVTACASSGWDLETYLDPEHPLQVAVREAIEELSGERTDGLAIDGCGAPLLGLPIVGMARAFGRIASATDGLERQIADAMRTHPEYVGGTGRDNTALMRALPGVIAKDGADSVYAVGLPDGRGLAVKIADGGERARGPVVAQALRQLGIDDEAALTALANSPVLGHGRVVGQVEAVQLG